LTVQVPDALARDAGIPDAVGTFVDALNRGDASVAVSLFSSEGCFITPDATVMRGRSALLGVFEQLVAARPQIEVQAASSVLVGDLAYVWGAWRYSSAGVSERYERDLSPRLVAQRAGGRWELTIVQLWG
jgi:uncharacterized protein (TIGR02246 family)